jgi:hypothetical protein
MKISRLIVQARGRAAGRTRRDLAREHKWKPLPVIIYFANNCVKLPQNALADFFVVKIKSGFSFLI